MDDSTIRIRVDQGCLIGALDAEEMVRLTYLTQTGYVVGVVEMDDSTIRIRLDQGCLIGALDAWERGMPGDSTSPVSTCGR